MDSFNNYVESSIAYTIDTEQSTKLSTMPSEKPVRHKPWTPEWINQILRTAELPRAVGHLRAWMPEKRQKEASEETVLAIRWLNHADSITALMLGTCPNSTLKILISLHFIFCHVHIIHGSAYTLWMT